MGDSCIETVGVSIRSLRLLRCGVKELFRTLADGNPHGRDESPDEKERDFFTDIQMQMSGINQRMRELESATNSLLMNPSATNLGHLGTTLPIAFDGRGDRPLLYETTVSNYRWCDRVRELALHAQQLLGQSQLKRTPYLKSRAQLQFPYQPRRSMVSGYHYPAEMVNRVLKAYSTLPEAQFELLPQAPGQPPLIQVTLGHAFRILLLLRGLIIEAVVAKGLQESFEDAHGRPDIWSESRYEVFRLLSEQITVGLLQLTAISPAEPALRQFLIWLAQFYDLFQKPCKRCGCLLRNNLPPIWRELQRPFDAYHLFCKA